MRKRGKPTGGAEVKKKEESERKRQSGTNIYLSLWKKRGRAKGREGM